MYRGVECKRKEAVAGGSAPRAGRSVIEAGRQPVDLEGEVRQ